MKYNNQSLLDYCSDNNIKLLSAIKDKLINREAYIEGKCITNNFYNNFHKNFRQKW